MVIAVILIILLFSGIGWYLSYRLYQGLSSFFPEIRLWPVMVLVCTMVLLMILGFGCGLMPVSREVKHLLGLIGGYCMGIMLYLLLFTVAADLLFIIPRLLKLSFTAHHLFKGYVSLGVLLLTMITCIGGFINAQRIEHVSYDVCLQAKQDVSDLNLVTISDLHLGAIGSEERLEKVVREINALNPDVVCIVGDFFDTDFASIRNPDAALQTLRKLQSTHGVYACLGNHDAGQTYGQMVTFLEKANIRLLNDTYAVVNERLVLIGRMDGAPIGGYGEEKRKAFSDIYIREDSELPVIVMDHNPANIDEYTAQADLILCGHTHKGQVFPANLITNLLYTVDYGYYQKDADSPHVIVTSGVGTWGMPMRVGTNCEIVTVRFVNAAHH